MSMATNEQLKAALTEALLIIEAYASASVSYMREDVADRVKESHINNILFKLTEVPVEP